MVSNQFVSSAQITNWRSWTNLLAHTIPPGVNVDAHTVHGVEIVIPALDADLTSMVYNDELQPIYTLSMKPSMNQFSGEFLRIVHVQCY